MALAEVAKHTLRRPTVSVTVLLAAGAGEPDENGMLAAVDRLGVSSTVVKLLIKGPHAISSWPSQRQFVTTLT